MMRDLYNFISPRHISDSGPVLNSSCTFIYTSLVSDPPKNPNGERSYGELNRIFQLYVPRSVQVPNHQRKRVEKRTFLFFLFFM